MVEYDIADPHDPNTLVVPFIFVPHGSPPPLEWMAAHPGWVKFPAVLVPRGSRPPSAEEFAWADYAWADAPSAVPPEAAKVAAGDGVSAPSRVETQRARQQRGVAELLGIPAAHAQVPEEEEAFRRIGPGGRELSPTEELRLDRYNEIYGELKEIEPDNRNLPSITTDRWVPGENIADLQAELAQASVRQQRFDFVINETLTGRDDTTSKQHLTSDEALAAGLKFLGRGSKEIGRPGSGVYRSADGLRQFRMDPNSLLGRHPPGVPHIHFETIDHITREVVVTDHVKFDD